MLEPPFSYLTHVIIDSFNYIYIYSKGTNIKNQSWIHMS